MVIFDKGLRQRSARNAETGDEGRREPETTDLCDTSTTRIQCDKRDGPRIATCLDLEDGREALEIVRRAEREPGLEQWRRLAALYDPLAAGRSLNDSRQILSPPKAAKIDDLSRTFQAWEIWEQRHRERTGDQLPEDMRLAILLSMCPTDLEKELTTQQHLFPVYAQMKAHIVTVIKSRTRSVAPMTMGHFL